MGDAGLIILIVSIFIIGFIVSFIIVSYLVFNGFYARVSVEKLEKTNMVDPGYNNCREKIKYYREKIKDLKYSNHNVISKDGTNLYGRLYTANS